MSENLILANKYEEYNDTEYGKLMGKANKLMAKSEKDALPAAVISKIILKILTKKRTKLAFVVNKNKFLTLLFIKFTPTRWVDAIFYKQFFK